MAVYIDDSGSHGFDAEISGVENTDWSRDATNKTFKLLTATGSADTGFTLSTTTGWILIESYNINGNDAGTVMWRSLTSWQSDVSTSTIRNTAMTDFRTDMATIISGTNITTYDAKCTYFDGTDAHVYEADEATAFPDEASPTYTISAYSPASSLFTITNTLVAPIEVSATNLFTNGTLDASLTGWLDNGDPAGSGWWEHDTGGDGGRAYAPSTSTLYEFGQVIGSDITVDVTYTTVVVSGEMKVITNTNGTGQTAEIESQTVSGTYTITGLAMGSVADSICFARKTSPSEFYIDNVTVTLS